MGSFQAPTPKDDILGLPQVSFLKVFLPPVELGVGLGRFRRRLILEAFRTSWLFL